MVILYINALSVLVPDVRLLFLARDVPRMLYILQRRLGQRPRGELDVLLAASSHALAALDETPVPHLAKEIRALYSHSPYVKDSSGWRVCSKLQETLRARQAELIRYSR